MNRWSNGARNLVALCSVAAAVALAACQREAATASRPDLSGWWIWNAPVDRPPNPFLDAPYKAPLADLVRQATDAFNRAQLPDLADLGVDQRRAYCAPQRFAGFNGGFEDSVEFLFTPGRLTITNEEGLIRRVALDQPLPAIAEQTNAGTAVAHWEGQMLVIETIGIHPEATFGPGPVGKDASFVERISLREPDVLQIQLKATVPAQLEKPYETTLVYHRERNHVFHDGSLSADSCLINDPSIDPVTGRQRLDMTPPPDLPPPPKD